MTDDTASTERAGALFALSAYAFWGVAPVYFFQVNFASPVEVLSHRIVWSVPLLALLITVQRVWPAAAALNRRQWAWLALSGALLSINWGVFVWALFSGRILETSLGYYINPLVSALLGVVFLKETLRPIQGLALALAALGVLNEVIAAGVVPWGGLVLAVTFGFYGLVRKRLAVPATVGLGAETLLMLPLALIYLVTLTAGGSGSFASANANEIAWLALGGLVTIFPLICFGAAATRLPLVTLGFFQYLAPTLTFLLAVVVYNEPFGLTRGVTFGCIWMAVIVFSVESALFQRRLSHRGVTV